MITFALAERMSREEIRKLPKDGSFEEFDMGTYRADPAAPIQAWRSRFFTVQSYVVPGRQSDAVCRLSVQRSMANANIRPQNRDLRPISWEDLQAVKAAVGFGDRWAVEIYPPEADVVDVAPMRHLWILEHAPDFAWRKDGAR